MFVNSETSTSTVAHHLRFHPSIRKASVIFYVVVTIYELVIVLVMTTEVAKYFLMYLSSRVLRYACNVLELAENIRPILYC